MSTQSERFNQLYVALEQQLKLLNAGRMTKKNYLSNLTNMIFTTSEQMAEQKAKKIFDGEMKARYEHMHDRVFFILLESMEKEDFAPVLTDEDVKEDESGNLYWDEGMKQYWGAYPGCEKKKFSEVTTIEQRRAKYALEKATEMTDIYFHKYILPKTTRALNSVIQAKKSNSYPQPSEQAKG